MRYQNEAGQVVYYNCVTKHGRERWLIQAASGQFITGRDRQKLRSRSFAQEHQADAWLERNGYKAVKYT
ncbi:MAG: hypothetical protein NC489_32225 [Ruminococcus flavefaciens]|nr:hypothetical protein [Ruminococcus flavefaciens]